MAFCTSCGAQMPAGASTCPACSRSAGSAGGAAAAPAPATVQASAGGLTDNLAGALAYVTIIPSILFLVMQPYNRNRFIRFHSFQNIFFAIAWIALWIVLNIIVHIPFLGWLTLLIWPIVGLAGFVIWLVLLLKAYQGQMFKLPMLGDIAEKQADAM
jgi:uncharacterized membrane protein